MLALAAETDDGAHPYWTTPEQTAQALEILGPDEMVCVEQKIVRSAARHRGEGGGNAPERIDALLAPVRAALSHCFLFVDTPCAPCQKALASLEPTPPATPGDKP